MNQFDLALVAVGGIVLAVGLCSRPLKKSFFSAPMLAFGWGILLGPAVTGLLDAKSWGDSEKILEEASRLTLAIGLMGVALRLPLAYPRRHWRTLLVLLGLGMPLMWLSGALLSYWILGVPWLIALLIGAIVSPTDPIVATSIVTGVVAEENLPIRVRHTLTAESGLNDGLAYPMVAFPVSLLTLSTSEAVEQLGYDLLWKVGGAILIGVGFGVAAAWALRLAEKENSIELRSFLAYTLALSLLVLGAAHLLDTDGILAVFIAGLAFDALASARERVEDERVQEAVNQFFTLPIFTLLGLMLPWDGWWQLGWRGVLLVAAVLLLHRLPAWLLLKPFTPQLRHWKDAWLLGWFGPIGVAAIFYSAFAVRKTGNEEIWHVTSLLICASLIAHGVTATPLARWYGRHSEEVQPS